MHIAIYMYIYIYVSLSTSVEYSGGRANIERTFENRYFHVSKLNVTLTQMGQMGEVYRGGDGLLGRVDGVAAMFFFFFFFDVDTSMDAFIDVAWRGNLFSY